MVRGLFAGLLLISVACTVPTAHGKTYSANDAKVLFARVKPDLDHAKDQLLAEKPSYLYLEVSGKLRPRYAHISQSTKESSLKALREIGADQAAKRRNSVDFRITQIRESGCIKELYFVFHPDRKQLMPHSEPGLHRVVTALEPGWILMSDEVDLHVFHLNLAH